MAQDLLKTPEMFSCKDTGTHPGSTGGRGLPKPRPGRGLAGSQRGSTPLSSHPPSPGPGALTLQRPPSLVASLARARPGGGGQPHGHVWPRAAGGGGSRAPGHDRPHPNQRSLRRPSTAWRSSAFGTGQSGGVSKPRALTPRPACARRGCGWGRRWVHPPPPTAHLGPVAVGELLSEQTADASLQGLHVGVPGGGGDKHTGTLRDEPPLAAATPSARPRGQHRAQTRNAVRQGPLTRVSRRHPRRTPTTPEAPTRSKRGCGQAVRACEGGQGVAGPAPSTSRGPGSRPHSSCPGAS